ncbi:queuosine precursor transporter [Legionella geestiana]|uniref:queuosine precursor transporter n=1 Tax=Legionella geestiana TaxID=45065 RepID=UPI00109247EA|nr:queuosine precursor transporter [Legionella geestiana]QDQ40478.1 queuosine precursor transporter [Legionella geestiana]
MNNIEIFYSTCTRNKYLPILSMLSVTLLLSALIFTYRIIELGPFLTPGGVVPFSLTYLMAAIITETYGYKNARKIIFGNFICIFIFSLTVSLLLKFPAPELSADSDAYMLIFNQAIYVTVVYSLGFLFSDLINALCVSKWKGLLKGRFFCFRVIGASIIAQASFSLIVIPSLYINSVSPERLLQQFLTTIIAKVLIILACSYPGLIAVRLLKKMEGYTEKKPEVVFNPY